MENQMASISDQYAVMAVCVPGLQYRPNRFGLP